MTLDASPAAPTVTWPTAGDISVGKKLSGCALTGGSATGLGGAAVTGIFEWTAPDTAITTAGSQSFGVTFKPDSANYSSTTGTVALNAAPATPTVTWPTASAVFTGQPLSLSTLSGGSATGVDGAAVSGDFAWDAPDEAIGTVGYHDIALTFTPDSGNYSPVQGTVSVQSKVINYALGLQAPASDPFAAGIVYGSGQTKTATFTVTNNSDVAVSGISAAVSGTDDIRFTISSPVNSGLSLEPSASTTFSVKALGTGDVKAYSASVSVSMTTPTGIVSSTSLPLSIEVTPATPAVSWPAASAIFTRQPLSKSTLSGGSATGVLSADVTGSFAWDAPDEAIGAVGYHNIALTFTPDSGNYSPVKGTVSVQSKVINYDLGLQAAASDSFAAAIPYDSGGTNTGSFTVTNNSDVAVSGISASLSGSDAALFTISAPINSALSLEPGSTTSFSVQSLGTGDAGTYTSSVKVSISTPDGDFSSTPLSISQTISRADQDAPALTVNASTDYLNPNGSIVGLTDAMEYRLASSGTYTSVPAGVTTLTGLGQKNADEVYCIRYKETSNYESGADFTATIQPAPPFTYTVDYDGQGYTSGFTARQVHTYDAAAKLNYCGYVREHTVTLNFGSWKAAENLTASAAFTGWATAAGGAPVYASEQSVSNLCQTPDGTVALYACWRLSGCTLPAAERPGYSFEGWSDTAGGSVVWKAGDTLTPDANTTVYCVMKALPAPSPSPTPSARSTAPVGEPVNTLTSLTPGMTPQEKAEAAEESVESAPGGGYAVSGAYASDKVYATREEALAAAALNVEQELAAAEINAFAEMLFGEEEAERFEELRDEAISSISVNPDGSCEFTTPDGETLTFESMEEAVAAAALSVEITVLGEKKNEIASAVGSNVTGCDEGFVMAGAEATLTRMSGLGVSNDVGSQLEELYQQALGSIDLAHSIQRVLNTMAEDYNAASASLRYTGESMLTLYNYYCQHVETVQTVTDGAGVEAESEGWKRQLGLLEVAVLQDALPDGIKLQIVNSAGMPNDVTVSFLSVEPPAAQLMSALQSGSVSGSGSVPEEDMLVLGAYDFALSSEGLSYSFDGESTVTLHLPADFALNRNFIAAYLTDDGGVEIYPCTAARTADGIDLSFTTAHFSTYVLMAQPPISLWWMLAPMLIIAALAAAYFVACRKEEAMTEGGKRNG